MSSCLGCPCCVDVCYRSEADMAHKVLEPRIHGVSGTPSNGPSNANTDRQRRRHYGPPLHEFRLAGRATPRSETRAGRWTTTMPICPPGVVLVPRPRTGRPAITVAAHKTAGTVHGGLDRSALGESGPRSVRPPVWKYGRPHQTPSEGQVYNGMVPLKTVQ
jgi:hypothetical protein